MSAAGDYHVPKYRAVTAHLFELLDELTEGAAIPPERELAVRFGVARETVRQAVRELIMAGRLRRQGRVTVVAGPKLVQPLALGSYTEGVRAAGRRPGRRLVTAERIHADGELAAALDLGPSDPVVHLERVLLADDEAIGLEDTYLPERIVPRILEDFDPATSLYGYLFGQGIVFDSATERIETVLAGPREAMLLGTNPSLPMLLLNRVSVNADGLPIEKVRSLFRGDRFSFTAALRVDNRSDDPA